MTSKLLVLAMAVGTTVISATTLHAASVTIATDVGDIQLSKSGIRDNTATHGTDLVGMNITANYLDGTSETLIWEADPTSRNKAGFAQSAALKISYVKTFFDLTVTKALASLQIDAKSGNAIFDLATKRNNGTQGDTPGTKRGFGYETIGGDDLAGEITATYSDAMLLRGQELGIDAFTTVLIDYTDLAGGSFFGNTQFKTDLDVLEVAGDLNPLTPVPLPGGLPLMATGLGLAWVAGRKRS